MDGHLGYSGTLASSVRLVIRRLFFFARCRVVRAIFIAGPLHGVEASSFSQGSLLELRSGWIISTWSGMLVVFDLVKLSILMDDGDFLAPMSEMVRKRGKNTARVTKVEGHASETWCGLVMSERMIGSAIRWLMTLLR